MSGCQQNLEALRRPVDETLDPTIALDGFKEITDTGITLRWKIETGDLRVKVRAPTTGWIAVGFNPSQMMKDANIIIGYVSNGTATIRDDYGISTISHESDITLGGRDDVRDKAGSESTGITEISFTIPLNSGDDYDRTLLAAMRYLVILAYGNQDNFTVQHSVRTIVQIQL